MKIEADSEENQSLLPQNEGQNQLLNQNSANYSVNFDQILEENENFEEKNVWGVQFVEGGNRNNSSARRMSAPSFHTPQFDAHSSVVHRCVTINSSLSVPNDFPNNLQQTNFKRIKSASAIQGVHYPPMKNFSKSLSHNALDSNTNDYKYFEAIKRHNSGSQRRKSYSAAGRWWNRHAWNITIICLVATFFFGPWVLNAWIDWGFNTQTPPQTIQKSTTIIIDSNIASIQLWINGTQPPEILTIPPQNISQEEKKNIDPALVPAEMLQPGLRFPLQQVLNQSIWQNIDYSSSESALPEQYFPDEIRDYHTRVLRRDRGEEIPSGIAIAMDRDSKEYKLMLGALEEQGKSALIVQNTSIAKAGSTHSSVCPQFGKCPRLFIAVTTRCCTGPCKASVRRNEIRNTWLKTAKEMYGDLVTVKFVIAQPALEDIGKAYQQLKEEVNQHNDIIFVPGLDAYRQLPNKTLRLLQYALSSPCDFTHIMKTDDDVYIRMSNLIDLLHETGNQNQFFTGNLAGIDRPPNQHGFQPVRNTASKWYVSQEELPDEISPTGVPYAEGWGYILSRDAASYVLERVEEVFEGFEPGWSWWGRLPWEDVMIGAILQNITTVKHSAGFKSAWGVCEPDTIVKHLDIDSPGLLQQLYDLENSGYWDENSVPCNTGDFQLGSMHSWRAWRNKNLPTGQLFLD